MTVSLVIPAYNEAERLPAFLRSISDYQKAHPGCFEEAIVVNDGSTDGTLEVVRTAQPELPFFRVIDQKKNQGKGAAVRAGVLAAKGELIIFMDADGATDIAELPKMIAALQEADMGVGNRWMAGAQTQRHSSVRRLAGFVYRSYMRLFGLGDIDTMCGFKGFRAEAARNLFSTLEEKRWLFDTEIAYKAVKRGYRIKNFPIRWESKDGSKLSTYDLLASAAGIWPLIARLKKNL